MTVTKAQVKPLIGKRIYAVTKNNTVVTGKLVGIKGNRLILEQGKGKHVKTKALLPLILFDLLAIGIAPYGYGYYNPYGYNPYNCPGYFW